MSKGRVTIPTDESFVEGTKEIAAMWGADAVRDCDGTELPKNVKELAEKVYNTYFIVRGDNEWAEKHPEETHRTFLMSARNLAESDTLSIDPMQGYFAQQIQPDAENLSYWEVYDRTSGEKHSDWKWDKKGGCVLIKNARPMHEYTVNFMAKVVWHPVQIYNYLTNNWTCAKQKMYDPAFPNTAEYIKKHMEEWCSAHPETDVVRFTTFLYQFTLIFNEKGKEKYVDWFGYGLSTSPAPRGQLQFSFPQPRQKVPRLDRLRAEEGERYGQRARRHRACARERGDDVSRRRLDRRGAVRQVFQGYEFGRGGW